MFSIPKDKGVGKTYKNIYFNVSFIFVQLLGGGGKNTALYFWGNMKALPTRCLKGRFRGELYVHDRSGSSLRYCEHCDDHNRPIQSRK